MPPALPSLGGVASGAGRRAAGFDADDDAEPARWRWLPARGSGRYHALLGLLGIGLLGPLGGVTAAYMNFSLGFFVGGQVLAGILGSTVTFGYGPPGRHGANYLQTAAASVAGMSGMGVLVQAMVWMGLPQPPVWQLVLYLLCIGMFGAGVGMLYTPILVDRLQLVFPSGLAVANILRALTDPALLRASVRRLGSGIALGIAGGLAGARIAALAAAEFSASTFGAGMVVGARIGVPAISAGLLGVALVPMFLSIGWLEPGDPPRKITFLIALGLILGAALVDLALILVRALPLRRAGGMPAPPIGSASTAAGSDVQAWQRVDVRRLWLWVAAWGAGIVATGHLVLGQPIGFLVFAVALVFVFALVNGISLGVSDSNPISSAFVVSVVLMAALGLADAGVGLMAGTVLLVSTSVACDMQQDRSTGWRLGTNRRVQFRYQVAGILMGALLAVGFARLFMAAYPVLTLDQTLMKAAEQPPEWSAAMTYKFVGVLRSLADDKPFQRAAIGLGVAIGAVLEGARVFVRALPGYARLAGRGRAGRAAEFALDGVLLPSPYALSFGGFVNLHSSLWFGAGGIVASTFEAWSARRRRDRRSTLPADMSSTSLVGGGLIAGDALAALGLGLAALLATVLGA